MSKRGSPFRCITKTGKIAPFEDWFALKDLEGEIGWIGHIDGVMLMFEDGMEVAFGGRHLSDSSPFPTDFPYKTREQLNELKKDREIAYSEDILKLGILSNDHDDFYVVDFDHPMMVLCTKTDTFIKIDPGVCLACKNGYCRLHQIKQRI